MIYVAVNDFNKQLDLLNFFIKKYKLNICIWLYPESSITEIIGLPIYTDSSTNIQPITTYEEPHKYKYTKLIKVDKSIIDSLYLNEKNLKNNCDSIALYKENSYHWIISTIGHEKMCLVNDLAYLNELIDNGFDVSTEAPSWW